jgi:hypothetical protein
VHCSENDCRNSENAQPHDEGEDGPGQQENGDGDLNCSICEPESAVGGESCGIKGVASLELPHTSQQLCKATVEHRQAGDDIRERRQRNAKDSGAIARQNERIHP